MQLLNSHGQLCRKYTLSSSYIEAIIGFSIMMVQIIANNVDAVNSSCRAVQKDDTNIISS